MLHIRMVEMPISELEQYVAAEVDDNPAFDISGQGDEGQDYYASTEDGGGFERQGVADGKKDSLDEALEGIGGDDYMPSATYREPGVDADYEEVVYGQTRSFYDLLAEQIGEADMGCADRRIVEYLAGSLDSDGILRKDIGDVADELAIYHNIDATPAQVESALAVLQDMEPAGIGARDLRECLLLQIRRKPAGRMRSLMEETIGRLFEDFAKKKWDKIGRSLKIDEDEAAALRTEILRLNPKPGAAWGEAEGRSMQQITPDFIVEAGDDGRVSFHLNRGDLPVLSVSRQFADMAEAYKANKGGMAKADKEALLYAKEKVDRARGFIEAVRQRRATLESTMGAIMAWQDRYFEDGDEAELKPMILKDIAEKTGLDISTVSRVCSQKYAQTPWGTFPLRFFFSDSYMADAGETSTRRIKIALKELIGGEDKAAPLSDDALAAAMKGNGYPIARRTVAKYREQMGLPVARLRKG